MKPLLALAAILLLAQCSHKPSRQKLLDRIAEAEKVLAADMDVNTEHALNAAQAYIDFVDAFPGDSMRPQFWFNAAQLFNDGQQPETAIALTDSFMQHHRTHMLAPRVLHLKGAVYEFALGDVGRARMTYELIISNYNVPEHFDIISATESSLENLGKTGDQIWEEMKAKGVIEGDSASTD